MIDIAERLKETNQAIAALRAANIEIPEEAGEIKEILERCFRAEHYVFSTTKCAEQTATALQLDREAYEAYARHTGWKSLATGADLPQWDQLSDEIRVAWRVSAAWVIGRTLRHFGVWRS